MGSALQKAIESVLGALSQDMTLGVWKLFSQLFVSPFSVFQNEDVQMLQVFVTTLALGMLPVMVIIQAIRLAGARAFGINTMPPELLAKQAILAGVAGTSISTLVWILMTFGDNLTQALSTFGLELTPLEVLMNPTGASIGLLFMIITMVLAAILLTIQKSIISAELAFMLIIGPVAGVSLVSGNSGFFNTWLRETASLIFTPVAQAMITILFMRTLLHFPLSDTSWSSRLVCFGFGWLLWKVPAFLRQFAYSAGHGDLLMQGGASVGRWAVMRQMIGAAGKSMVPGSVAGTSAASTAAQTVSKASSGIPWYPK